MSKADQERISGAILELVPQDGSSIGNIRLLGMLRQTWPDLDDEEYFRIRDALVASGVLATGRGQDCRQIPADLHHPGKYQPAHSPPSPSSDTAHLNSMRSSRAMLFSISREGRQCKSKDLILL